MPVGNWPLSIFSHQGSWVRLEVLPGTPSILKMPLAWLSFGNTFIDPIQIFIEHLPQTRYTNWPQKSHLRPRPERGRHTWTRGRKRKFLVGWLKNGLAPLQRRIQGKKPLGPRTRMGLIAPVIRGVLTWMVIQAVKEGYRVAAGMVLRKAMAFIKWRNHLEQPHRKKRRFFELPAL